VGGVNGAEGRSRASGRPKILDTLDLAEAWRVRLETGEVNRADLARENGISRARVTQVMAILNVHPQILEWMRENPVSERRLRPLMRLPHGEQPRLALELGIADVAHPTSGR